MSYIGKFIKIVNIADITEFCRRASGVEGDVLCRRGRFTIDGKSLMGLFSIDTAAGFTVEVEEKETDFINYIKRFEQ